MSKVASEPFGLSDEQREIQALCREFAQREIRPISQAVDEADTEMPWEVWYKAAEVGITSFMLPEEYGGGGMTDCLTGCIVQEELCWGCSGIGNLVTSGGFFAEPVLALGTDEQKRRWIEPLTGEKPVLTALATTEPGAGSDAASIQTTATKSGDGYVLRGQKSWISNGGIADFYVVFATVAPGTRSKGVTAFVVEKGDQGVSFGAPMKKMGQRAIVNAEMFLEDAELPADRRLGDEGQGFYGLMHTFDRSRVTLARRRRASRAPRSSTRSSTRSPASSSGSRSPSTRPSPSGSPTWRRASTRRGSSSGEPHASSTRASRPRSRPRWRSSSRPRRRCGAPGPRCRRWAAGATPASTRSRSGCGTPSSRRSRKARPTSSA